MKTTHLYILLIILYAITTITRIMPIGFHPDSLVYMTMARNLAEGEFSFWSLHFTNNIFNDFYEHPPLGIYIMSLFFSVFGDSILIDKLFGTFFGLLITIEIMLIYNLVAPEQKKNGVFLAAIYFMLFPMTGYTLENNLLEIPTAFFTLASVYIFLRASILEKNGFVYPLLFTIALSSAFLVKGPIALFPLVLPFFYFSLFHKEYNIFKMLHFYKWMFIFIILFSFLLYTYIPAHDYLSTYFSNQLLASINGSRGGDSHFKLTTQLILDFSALSLISFIILIVGKVKLSNIVYSRMFLLFIFIGISASIPLEISPRQHNYYLFPSLPYFAIALSILFFDSINIAIKKWGKYKLITYLNLFLVLVFIAIAWQKTGSYKRHENFHHDFRETNVELMENAKITTCANNNRDNYDFFINTEFTGNLARYYKAEIFKENTKMEYFLTTKDSLEYCLKYQSDYIYIGSDKAKHYLLYKLKDE